MPGMSKRRFDFPSDAGKICGGCGGQLPASQIELRFYHRFSVTRWALSVAPDNSAIQALLHTMRRERTYNIDRGRCPELSVSLPSRFVVPSSDSCPLFLWGKNGEKQYSRRPSDTNTWDSTAYGVSGKTLACLGCPVSNHKVLSMQDLAQFMFNSVSAFQL